MAKHSRPPAGDAVPGGRLVRMPEPPGIGVGLAYLASQLDRVQRERPDLFAAMLDDFEHDFEAFLCHVELWAATADLQSSEVAGLFERMLTRAKDRRRTA